MAVATSFELPPGSPAGVVETALDLLDELEQVLWSARTPGELLETNTALEAVRSRIAAAQARVAAEIDATDAAKAQGWASVPDYLTATAGARRAHGNRLLRTARALTSDRPATHRALHHGAISPEHAEVIVKVINQLPVDTGLRAARPRPCCWPRPPTSTPPSSRPPVTTCSRSSTPTAPPAARSRSSTSTSVPPTSTGSSRSSTTASAG
jgi:hypothetical protein